MKIKEKKKKKKACRHQTEQLSTTHAALLLTSNESNTQLTNECDSGPLFEPQVTNYISQLMRKQTTKQPTMAVLLQHSNKLMLKIIILD
jgi:hypothetical protein